MSGNTTENESILSFDANSSEPLTINILVSSYEETRPRIVSMKVTGKGISFAAFEDDSRAGMLSYSYQDLLELMK